MARAKRERAAFAVFLDAPELGELRRIGALHANDIKTALPASFEYAKEWIASDSRFLVDPRLELWPGEQHPRKGAVSFGVFMDSAPDRWGRVLMERREALLARQESRPPRMLRELDFLLGVHDQTRIGALRFRADSGGSFLDDRDLAAPPITSLRELAEISRKLEQPGVEQLPAYEEWLAMLVAPGTSLGGARPKATFMDHGRLWIAKFPAGDDRHDVGAWELLVHQLASRAQIVVPISRVEQLSERHSTFCVSRFDRTDASGRRMYVSAMTLLDREHSDRASYLDLAELISNHGAKDHVAEDLEQLFRRMIFNVTVGNRDDHLRNHGFIREPSGWRLSPAFDLNPNPYRTEHVLTLDGDSARPDLDTAISTGDLYRLDPAGVDRIVREVRNAVVDWRGIARRLAIPPSEMERIGTVFQ